MIDGKGPNGKFKQLYTYGGRSFSIWRASDMEQIYDSGSDLGEKTSETRKQLFNTDIKSGDETVAYRTDKRSDNRVAILVLSLVLIPLFGCGAHSCAVERAAVR